MSENSRDNWTNDLSRLELRKAHRIWIMEGPIITVFGTLTSGAFQTGYAIALGCNNFMLGILSGLGSFTCILQLFAPQLMRLFPSRGLFVGYGGVVGRLLWIPMAFIPLFLPHSIWAWAFVFFMFISCCCPAATGATWTDWMGDIVPPASRGKFFGVRNLWGALVGLVVSIVGGVVFDHATKVWNWSIFRASGALFLFAAPFAFFSFLCCCFSPDVSAKRDAGDEGKGILAKFAEPFLNPTFRPMLYFSLAVTFTQQIAGQFFLVYQLKDLHHTYSMIQILNAFSAVTSMMSMPFWGYLSDKYGNKPILILSCMLTVFAPFLWCFTVPDPYPGFWGMDGDHFAVSASKLILIFVMVTAGFGWAGIGLTQFNAIIAAAPDNDRTTYFAVNSTLTGILGGVSPLVGGAIADALVSVHFPTTGIVRCSYHVLFILSGLLRFLMIWCATRLHEPESKSAGYVIGQIKSSKPVSSFAAISQLGKAGDSKSRLKAAEQLGKLKTPVAVEELVKALDDVSLPVREQAAASLGEIGDSRAVKPLLSHLKDTSSGISFEAAVALGKIGDKSALPALAAVIQLGGPLLRRHAAVQALGRIDHPHAPKILLPLLSEKDPTLRMAAIRSLAEYPDVLAENETLELLLNCCRTETDSAALSAFAEALALTGRIDVAPRLLEITGRNLSHITEREILNAIGSLLGGSDSFYAYLVLDGGARDDAVQKILTSLQKNMLKSRKHRSPRAAVRLRQALKAYLAGEYGKAVSSIWKALLLVDGQDADTNLETDYKLQVLRTLAETESCEGNTSPEKAMLAVFILMLKLEK